MAIYPALLTSVTNIFPASCISTWPGAFPELRVQLASNGTEDGGSVDPLPENLQGGGRTTLSPSAQLRARHCATHSAYVPAFNPGDRPVT